MRAERVSSESCWHRGDHSFHGQGAIFRESNRIALKKTGIIVCLDAEPGVLFKRVTRTSVNKRIDHPNTVIILAMVEGFGIKSPAPQLQSGSNDCCIPMGNLKSAPNLHGGDHQFETDRQNDSCRREFQRSFDVRLADSQFFSFSTHWRCMRWPRKTGPEVKR